MFVRPRHRGRASAPKLIATIAARVQADGGRFVKGHANAKLEKRYQRSAVLAPGDECYVGNAAFRALARLADTTPRALVRGLPDASLNFER
jgi:hypothetical protein